MPQDGASNPLITVTFFPEQMNLTTPQLDDLIENYCTMVVDSMDTESMEQMLYELMVDSFAQYSEHDMEDLITSTYGEDLWKDLVENVTQEEVSQDT